MGNSRLARGGGVYKTVNTFTIFTQHYIHYGNEKLTLLGNNDDNKMFYHQKLPMKFRGVIKKIVPPPQNVLSSKILKEIWWAWS